MALDAPGQPLKLILIPDLRGEALPAPALPDGLSACRVLAGKACN